MAFEQCFSQEIKIFHGRQAPEPLIVAGYGAIIDALKLKVPMPVRLSAISKKHRKYQIDGWQVFTPRHQPKDTLYDQLVFAFKYEGVNLLFFKKLFERLSPVEVAALVQTEPLGQYCRKMWFLYEWLTTTLLPLPDLQSGNYVTLLDTSQQYGIDNGLKSGRHRIINNLPGSLNFCPLITKTAQLEQIIASNLAERNRRNLGQIHKEVLVRTAAYLMLKDSKASFSIEGEKPLNSRAVRWGKAIGQAGIGDLTKDELLRLQQIVIEDPRFVKMGFRRQGGFIGEHDRVTGEPIPSHISAKWQDLDTLIDGLLNTSDLLLKHNMDPVLSAALISFGFVFIHPIEDGNGRIHRYLIHHLLAKKQFVQHGIIFPVSASILDHIDDYRNALGAYSEPLSEFIQWKETSDHNIEVLNDTIDYYRYFDATRQAEFLYDCVKDTIDNIIPQEIRYLSSYDEFRRYLDDAYEMPDRMVALAIKFLAQNNGRFSKRAREKEFVQLTALEAADIEDNYRQMFNRESNS